jgi:HSP20 family protein
LQGGEVSSAAAVPVVRHESEVSMATATAPAPAPAKSAVPARVTTPFDLLHNLSREMDRMFGEFGLRRRWPFMPLSQPEDAVWSPEIEVTEDKGKLQVRLDLPGLKKEDVKVDVTDDALVVQGERRQEQERKDKGFYRSERSYGRFFRSIALPEGAKPETAKASFTDGVLEVVMDTNAPPAPVTRRIEIGDAAK